MEKYVLTVEQMNELESLGIDTSRASMCWNTYDSFLISNNYALIDSFNYSDDCWQPTFTLSDILSFFEEFEIHAFLYNGIMQYHVKVSELVNGRTSDESLIDAAFAMLKLYKEKNLI